MKKLLILFVILIFVLMLIPVRGQLKDGGTVVYTAVLYSVYDLHQLNPDLDAPNKYIEGIIIKILGIEVYNSTK